MSQKKQIRIIVTGPQGSGKTTFVENLTSLAKDRYTIGGFLSHGTWLGNKRDSFTIEDLMTGQAELLCDQQDTPGSIKFRHFFFKPRGFIFGECAIEHAIRSKYKIIVFDEIGPMELQANGWAGSLTKALSGFCPLIIMVVRQSLVEKCIDHWKIKGAEIYDTGQSTPGQLYKRICEII